MLISLFITPAGIQNHIFINAATLKAFLLVLQIITDRASCTSLDTYAFRIRFALILLLLEGCKHPPAAITFTFSRRRLRALAVCLWDLSARRFAALSRFRHPLSRHADTQPLLCQAVLRYVSDGKSAGNRILFTPRARC